MHRFGGSGWKSREAPHPARSGLLGRVTGKTRRGCVPVQRRLNLLRTCAIQAGPPLPQASQQHHPLCPSWRRMPRRPAPGWVRPAAAFPASGGTADGTLAGPSHRSVVPSGTGRRAVQPHAVQRVFHCRVRQAGSRCRMPSTVNGWGAIGARKSAHGTTRCGSFSASRLRVHLGRGFRPGVARSCPLPARVPEAHWLSLPDSRMCPSHRRQRCPSSSHVVKRFRREACW